MALHLQRLYERDSWIKHEDELTVHPGYAQSNKAVLNTTISHVETVETQGLGVRDLVLPPPVCHIAAGRYKSTYWIVA